MTELEPTPEATTLAKQITKAVLGYYAARVAKLSIELNPMQVATIMKTWADSIES